MATLKRKADATSSAADLKKPKKDSSLTSFFGVPKVTNSTTSSASLSSSNGAIPEAPAPKFDKNKWVSTLTAEQKQLLKLEIDTLDPSWLVHLKEELVSREFLELKRFLQREIDTGKKIFPPFAEIYSW
jgi:uracil-DNA glycosylase